MSAARTDLLKEADAVTSTTIKMISDRVEEIEKEDNLYIKDEIFNSDSEDSTFEEPVTEPLTPEASEDVLTEGQKEDLRQAIRESPIKKRDDSPSSSEHASIVGSDTEPIIEPEPEKPTYQNNSEIESDSFWKESRPSIIVHNVNGIKKEENAKKESIVDLEGEEINLKYTVSINRLNDETFGLLQHMIKTKNVQISVDNEDPKSPKNEVTQQTVHLERRQNKFFLKGLLENQALTKKEDGTLAIMNYVNWLPQQQYSQQQIPQQQFLQQQFPQQQFLHQQLPQQQLIPTIDYQQWKPAVQPQHLNFTIENQQWKPTVDYQ